MTPEAGQNTDHYHSSHSQEQVREMFPTGSRVPQINGLLMDKLSQTSTQHDQMSSQVKEIAHYNVI